MNRFIKMMSMAAVMLCGTHLAAHAVIIKVTDPQGGADYASMNVVVEEVRNRLSENPEQPIPAVIDGYEVAVTDANVMPVELSMSPGASAVYWSDKSVRYEAGFSMSGGRALFQTAAEPSLRPVRNTEDAPPVFQNFTNRLTAATVADTRLMLRYSAAGPGPVTAELFSVNGGLIKRWNWVENAAGIQSRAFDVPRIGNGLHVIRWSQGNYRAVRKLVTASGKSL